MTDLRLIHYFEVVYRLLSFSKAAEELHLTHSAVTRSIKALEDAWGTQLFYRTTRSVVPTEAGTRLYPMAVELLAFSETVQRETVSGDRELKLIGGPIALDIMLPSSIVAFRDAAPAITVFADVMPPHIAIEELVQRRTHMVIFNMSTLEAMPHASRLRFREILADDFVMVCRPGHPVLTGPYGIDRLLEYPWAFPGYLQYLDGRLPEGWPEKMQAAGAPQYTLYTPTASMELAIISDVLTIIPLTLAAANLESGRLASRYLPNLPRYRIGVGIRRETEREPNIATFIDSLTRSARTLETRNAERLKRLL
jgi:LysR family transcriptional regulator, regulator of abg operon